MEVTLNGSSREIADLVLGLQEQVEFIEMKQEHGQIPVDGSTEIRCGGMEACGFKFSSMQELVDKVNYYASGENFKIKVCIDFPECERVCGDGKVINR